MAGYYAVYNDECLMHHGVKGMKWGVRKRGKIKGAFGPLSTTKVHYKDGSTGYVHDAIAGTRKNHSHESGFGRTKKEAKVNATARLASDSYVRGEYLSKKGLAKAEKIITKYYSKHYKDLSSSKDLNKRSKAYVESVLKKNLSKTTYNTIVRQKKLGDFVSTSKSKGLKQIDDLDALDMWMDDPSFRKEYEISDSEYKRYKKEVG